MDEEQEIESGEPSDEALLKEIRDDYKDFSEYWREAREERAIDLRYLCGDPWDPEDRKERKANGRPCINHDELNQYVNQGVNALRQNRRGIKIEPRGNGASDQTALLRQDKVRTIEYRSKAQDIYLQTAQDMFEGSYGFCRVSRKYVVDNPTQDDERAFHQEIVLKPIPNPDSVLYDPYCKEKDWSDARKVFIVEPIPRSEFARKYPNAEKCDFSAEDMRTAPQWISDKVILVAEYWRVTVTMKTFKRGGQSRQVEKKQVMQYITNGVEILERNPQPGTEIPIPAMIALERYVDEGGTTKRKLFSLVRLAREPQMTLAYLCSQETEEAGMTPKVPIIGYTGQFETDSERWETLNKVPAAYVMVDAVPDPTNPTQVLPLPQWRQFTPNFGAYEIAKDGARRAIQAAVGSSPLPTAAQRRGEKSGAALDRIEEAEAVGSLHFGAGYDRAVERAGRIIDSWMPVVYDTERDEWLHQADDSRRHVRLNTSEPYPDPETQQPVQHQIGDEEHDVTVSTGPSYRSQREAVDKFLDNLIANLPQLPVPPPAAAKLLAMAIQMKELGPKGDQMADIISPPEGDQGQQLHGMQQQMQQQGQLLQALQGELQKLQLEKQGKVIDNEYKLKLEQLKVEADLAKAEITTKAQSLEERLKFVEDAWLQLHGQAHEAGMQAQDHQQAQTMADQQAAQAQQQQQMQAQQQQQPQPPQVSQ